LVIVLVAFAGALSVGPASAATHVFGIPPIVFSAYLNAESRAPGLAVGCQVPWPVVAGIWKVESNHATQPGRTITPAGTLTPPLYGPILDGSTAGAAIIGDTDQGVLDGNPTWDRAVGPAQFLPGSWNAYRQDGNDDGVADPQNVYDAALATAAHLCIASPGDYTNTGDLERALRRYNNSAEYVATVRGWIDYYQVFQFT
jgi:membrane-bound lytic murein transglycosylase B